MLSLWSCTRETVPGGETEGEGIVLDFFCVSHATKAGMSGVKDGEDAWNENLISTLDVFLYTGSGTGNCIMHKKVTPNNNSGKASVSIFTDDSSLNTLVPDGNFGFWAYAVANYPGTLVANENDLSNTSVEYLKSLALSCDFSAAAGHRQTSFVMDGMSFVTSVDKSARVVARGEVGLKRVASKITVQLKIPAGIEIEKTTTINDEEVTYYERWEPMTGGDRSIQMYIENAVSNTTLEAKPVNNPTYFTYKNNLMTFTLSTAQEDADYPWVTDPTYVYPQHWEYASKTSPTKEPTIKLILPWRRISRLSNGVQVNATQKQFYYKIIIPDDTRADDGDDTFLRNFVRNNWYSFKMEVGMLGSETDEAAVALSGYYYVVDWQDKDVVEKQAAIGKARFLSVEPKEHTLYNENTLKMLYTSSHPVALNTTKGGTVMDITATRIYYGEKAANSTVGGGTVKVAASGNADYESGQKYIEYDASQRKALNNNEDWVKVDGDYVVFTHPLNNNSSAGEYFDSTPYIVRYTLHHADHKDESYKQTVTITQYPAMYIEVSPNDDPYPGSSANDYGYVYINGTTSSYGGVGGNLSTSDSKNKNPNMYVITTTVLPNNSTYYLGDPRSSAINNNLGDNNNNWSASAAAVGGGTRRLSYYYPAIGLSDMIAPQFRVASSFGQSTAVSYTDAQKRCASYQESGYPAGRWRLPTKAEIIYMIQLSEWGIIPVLFSPDTAVSKGGYWCSDGVVYPLENNGNKSIEYHPTAEAETLSGRTTNWPRCVYDEWYWGSGQISNLKTFTWGDQER